MRGSRSSKRDRFAKCMTLETRSGTPGAEREALGEDLEAKSDDREAHGADIKSFSRQFLCLNIENTFFFLVPKVLFGNGND